MLRKLLESKLHRATITRTDLDYEGSIAIDECLLDAADIRPLEAVHVWNIKNGARLETYAIAAECGSREICLNSTTARLAVVGDRVIIASFQWVDESRTMEHLPEARFRGQPEPGHGKTVTLLTPAWSQAISRVAISTDLSIRSTGTSVSALTTELQSACPAALPTWQVQN